MREALTILGFGPCHHMFEVIANAEQKALWRALAAGGKPDWEKLFAGYHSCVDWPSAYYWRALIDYYPDARAAKRRYCRSCATALIKNLLGLRLSPTGIRPQGLRPRACNHGLQR
jgi:hypothetical protein